MKETLEREIKTIKANLNNDAIPDFAKEPLKKKLAELELKLAESVGKAAKPAIDRMAEKAAKQVQKSTSQMKPKGSRAEEISRSSNETEVVKLLFDSAKQEYIVAVENKRTGDIDAKPVVGDMIKVATTYISRLKARMDVKEISTGTFTVWLADQGGEKIYNNVREFATKKQIAFPTFSNSGAEKKTEKRPSEKKELVDWDCDELIEKEKAKLKKRKAAQKKRSNKSEPTKQRERVEKVTATVEKSIKERIKTGKSVSKKEVLSLIEMYEREIADLKKLLNTL